MSKIYKKQIFFCFSYACHGINILAKKLFRRASLLILIIGIFLLPEISTAVSITPENIIALTNKEREIAGINSLSANQLLSKAAYDKGGEILANQTFQHNIEGKKFSSWISNAGYYYSYVGENLAINFITAEGVLKAWKNSPTHNKNLMNPLFKEIGVAVIDGEFEGKNTLIVVQIFGAPPVLSAAPLVLGENEMNYNSLIDNNTGDRSYAFLNSIINSAVSPSNYNKENLKLTNNGPSPLPVLEIETAGSYKIKDLNIVKDNIYNNPLVLILFFPVLVLVYLSVLSVFWLYYYYFITLVKLNTGTGVKI